MMLRSSSTPVLGSLLQSFSDCPNHQSDLHKHPPNSLHPKISCCSNGGASQDFRKSIFHPSPSVAGSSPAGAGFRRAQSDGNLEGLVDNSYSVDEFSLPKRSGRRNSCSILEAIPSAHNLWTSFEDDDDDYSGAEEEEEEEDVENGGGFKSDFDYYNPMRVENLGLEKLDGNGGLGLQSEGKMYLASGIGVSGVDYAGRGGGGGRGSYRPVDLDKDGGDTEEHYQKMLGENPGNPLLMRNYAEFLYKMKGDAEGAEEYYARAILADQEDGESLSQYAKIIWELHRDRERAANYFERAIVAASQSSHIHAAYANFLWEAEEEEEDEEEEGRGSSQVFLHQGLMASATA